jgi:hypothetical protein
MPRLSSYSTWVRRTALAALVVITDDLHVQDGSVVQSLALDTGTGGSVDVQAERVTIAGDESRIASDVGRGARGSAGALAITASQVELVNGGVIASATFGQGAGNLVAITTDDLVIANDAETPGGAPTGVIASSQPGSEGGAGNIVIHTPIGSRSVARTASSAARLAMIRMPAPFASSPIGCPLPDLRRVSCPLFCRISAILRT